MTAGASSRSTRGRAASRCRPSMPPGSHAPRRRTISQSRRSGSRRSRPSKTTSSSAFATEEVCRTSATRASTRSWPRRAPRRSSRCSSRTSSRSSPAWPSDSRRALRCSISVVGAVGRSFCSPSASLRARSSATTSRADAIAFATRASGRTRPRERRASKRDLSTFDTDAEPEAFAYVTTFDAVHDQAHPLALLRGIRRTMKPDGVYLMQDIQGSSHDPREHRPPGRAAPVHDLHACTA